MKCQDIPDRLILEFLLHKKPTLVTSFTGFDNSIHNAVTPPTRMIMAKMKQLIRKGLLTGCTCGCRGDFQITNKGEEYLLTTTTND